MTDFPTPRYAKGQRVFEAGATPTADRHPCPDCLGTHTWNVETPAGSTFEAACQRCASYSSRDMPSLAFRTWEPRVRALTIGSIRIETDRKPDEQVAYMCVETGIGSGTIYYEHRLHATREEADAAAQTEVAKHKLAEQSKPERIEQLRVAHLTLRDAMIDRAESAIRDAYWTWAHLRDAVAALVEESSLTEDEKEALSWDVGIDERHRRRPLMARVVAAAQAVVDGADTGSLADALSAIPNLRQPMNAEQAAKESAS